MATATLTWNADPDATGQAASYRELNASPVAWTPITPIGASSASATVNPNTEYEFKVQRNCEDTTLVSDTFQECVMECASPDLVFAACDDGEGNVFPTLRVSFPALSGDIGSYKLCVYEKTAGSPVPTYTLIDTVILSGALSGTITNCFFTDGYIYKADKDYVVTIQTVSTNNICTSGVFLEGTLTHTTYTAASCKDNWTAVPLACPLPADYDGLPNGAGKYIIYTVGNWNFDLYNNNLDSQFGPIMSYDVILYLKNSPATIIDQDTVTCSPPNGFADTTNFSFSTTGMNYTSTYILDITYTYLIDPVSGATDTHNCTYEITRSETPL